jgi:hypothetical protein
MYIIREKGHRMSKEMNFGVDMVYISSPEFRVGNLEGWSIKSGNKVGQDSEPFGISKEGQILEGTGYYRNRSKDGILNASWNLSKKGCLVQFNPSTLLHDYELTANLEHVIPCLQSDMKQLGVDMDLKGARLARLDLTGQRILESPCSSFAPAFTSLSAKRMKGVKYPDGFEFSNRSRGVVFYDKSLQLETVKAVKNAPRNLLRCEARWMKNRVIGHEGNGVGVSSLLDLIEAPEEHLKAKYKGFLERDVFKVAEGSQLAFSFKNHLQTFKTFKETTGGWKEYFMMNGLENLLEEFGGFDQIEQLFLCSGFSMKQAGRNIKMLQNLIQKKSFIDSSKGVETLASSIDTLRQAFTA